MARKRRIAYWLLLLVLVYTAGIVLSIGETQARYENTVVAATVVQGQTPGITSNCLVTKEDAPLTVLLGELSLYSSTNVSFWLKSTGADAVGKLAWSVSDPEHAKYLKITMQSGLETIEPNTEIDLLNNVYMDISMILTPTEIARTTAHEAVKIQVLVTWGEEMWGTFQVILPEVKDQTTTVEDTEQDTTGESPEGTGSDSTGENREPDPTEEEPSDDPESVTPTDPTNTNNEQTEATGTGDETQTMSLEENQTETEPSDPPEETTEPSDPTDDTTVAAIDETTTDPTDETTTDPTDETTTDPTDETTTDPTDETTTDPTDETTTDPTDETATDPTDETTTDPTDETTTDPTDETTTDPTDETTTDPGGETTTDPTDETTTDPTDETEPEEEEVPKPPIRLETISCFDPAEKLPLKVVLTKNVTSIRLGLWVVDEDSTDDPEKPAMVFEPFPDYTKFSLNQGESYYMMYDGYIAEFSLQGITSLSLLLDFSHAELDDSQALSLAMEAYEGDTLLTSCQVDTVPDARESFQTVAHSLQTQPAQVSEEEKQTSEPVVSSWISQVLTRDNALELKLPMEWLDADMEYTVEMLTMTQAGELVYSPVTPSAESLSVRYTDYDGTHNLVLRLGETLPQAGTYRVTMNWTYEGICYAHTQTAFFINYSAHTAYTLSG